MTGEQEPQRPRTLIWLESNRLGVAMLLGVIWMAVMFLFVRNAAVAVICGAAFAGILAIALPRPPS